MKAMKRAGITAASIIEKIGLKKDDSDDDTFDPAENDVEDVYGPPEWFEGKGKEQNEAEGVYGPPPEYEVIENLQPPVYGPPNMDPSEWPQLQPEDNEAQLTYGPPPDADQSMWPQLQPEDNEPTLLYGPPPQ